RLVERLGALLDGRGASLLANLLLPLLEVTQAVARLLLQVELLRADAEEQRHGLLQRRAIPTRAADHLLHTGEERRQNVQPEGAAARLLPPRARSHPPLVPNQPFQRLLRERRLKLPRRASGAAR